MFFWNATYWTPEGIKYNTIRELYKSEGILYLYFSSEIEAFWLLHDVFQIVLGDWKLPHLFFSVQAVVRVVSVQCETWEVWFNIHYH